MKNRRIWTKILGSVESQSLGCSVQHLLTRSKSLQLINYTCGPVQGVLSPSAALWPGCTTYQTDSDEICEHLSQQDFERVP